MSRHVLPPESTDALRFHIIDDGLVHDAATGLFWPRSANLLGYPLPWAEALTAVADLNAQRFLGRADWRMPNRRELRSLVDHGRKMPALPAGHPFRDVFLGWFWSSTTKAGRTAYAWNTHLEGGRTFFSRKDEYRLLWPVAGESAVLPRTGQTVCSDGNGGEIACAGSGQDGELRMGVPWPEPRFVALDEGVAARDELTGLEWTRPGDAMLTWEAAMGLGGRDGWRLPDIDELESLTDAARADPALPDALAKALGRDPALDWPEGFWSATTSGFDPAWAFVLYVGKGAVGVGYKPGAEFAAWLVREGK